MTACRRQGRSIALVASTICPVRDVDLKPVRSTIQGRIPQRIEAIGGTGGLHAKRNVRHPPPGGAWFSYRERERENMEAPVTNIVTYVPRKGKEAELLALVRKHEPALRKVGLVTAEPFKVWKAFDIRKERVAFIEYFQWKDGRASDVAHETPEVMAVWEPMGPVLEELTICEVDPA
jgi:hypothetical protein